MNEDNKKRESKFGFCLKKCLSRRYILLNFPSLWIVDVQCCFSDVYFFFQQINFHVTCFACFMPCWAIDNDNLRGNTCPYYLLYVLNLRNKKLFQNPSGQFPFLFDLNMKMCSVRDNIEMSTWINFWNSKTNSVGWNRCFGYRDKTVHVYTTSKHIRKFGKVKLNTANGLVYQSTILSTVHPLHVVKTMYIVHWKPMEHVSFIPKSFLFFFFFEWPFTKFSLWNNVKKWMIWRSRLFWSKHAWS